MADTQTQADLTLAEIYRLLFLSEPLKSNARTDLTFFSVPSLRADKSTIPNGSASKQVARTLRVLLHHLEMTSIQSTARRAVTG